MSEVSGQIDTALKLCLESKRGEADSLLQKLISLSEQEFGGLTSSHALALTSIARAYEDMGEFVKARQLLMESSDLLLRDSGSADSLYSVNLGELAQIFYFQRSYDSAGIYIRDALGLLERKLDKESMAYSKNLMIAAFIALELGKYDLAKKQALDAKNIIEKQSGKDGREYILNLALRGKLNFLLGNYSQAEALLREALNIYLKMERANDLARARIMLDLANLYVDQGNYEMADSLFLEGLSIEERMLGVENLEYSMAWSDYGFLLSLTGQFDKAEPAFLHHLRICDMKLGKDHLEYSTACNNLALFYDDMGNYQKAEFLLLEAKSITEKVIGKRSMDYSTVLNNLGHLYQKMGFYDKAETLHLEDMDLCPEIMGDKHPECITSMYHLAFAYFQQGKYRKADSLYQLALTKWKKLVGDWNSDYAFVLYSYGKLQMSLGNLAKADSLINKAKSIQSDLLGKDHLNYLETCISLAELLERQGKWRESENMQLEIKRIQLANLSKAARYLSESELSKYIQSFEQTHDLLLSFLAHRALNKIPVGLLPQIAYDYSLFYKGFLLNSAQKLNVCADLNPRSGELNKKRKIYYHLLANEYSRPKKERDMAKVNDLLEEINTIEKELAKLISGYSEFNAQVGWKDLKSKLNQGEAVIEFISFHKSYPYLSDSVLYGANLLKFGSEIPEFIFLCEKRSIDSVLLFNGDRKSDYVNLLYTLNSRGAVAVESSGNTLFNLFWKPIENRLEGVKTIYFSPSGLLHRINLDAIPVSDVETLADHFQLIQLGSTRQVVISDKTDSLSKEVVLYGGIQFEWDTSLNNSALPFYSTTQNEKNDSDPGNGSRGESWSYLPGTDREVNSIEKLVQASGFSFRVRKGFEATEESFKKLGSGNFLSPRILHIATHGYFFPDPSRAKLDKGEIQINKGISEKTFAADSVKSESERDQSEPVFKISDHPMLRSGLILSGGNATWHGKKRLEGKEDGILTAYEISQMNLSHTELVVLSACETGLGDIQGNEGVYGLQRAFKIAGAKYLIMSLWQVPDKQTSMLMTTFYRKWLEAEGPGKDGKGMSIPEAFHAAQKDLRENGLDPFYWAGFVLVQ